MRKLFVGLGICVALSAAGRAFAQTPNSNRYEQDVARSTGRQASLADQVIYERAVREARERESRIESRHWAGISAQRPTPTWTLITGAGLVMSPPWHPVVTPSYYAGAVWLR